MHSPSEESHTVTPSSRRRLLAGLGTVGTAGVSGCLGLGSFGSGGPDFQVRDLDPGEIEVHRGDRITVAAIVANVGDEEGSRTVELRADGEVLETASVTVDAGGHESVSFEEVETKTLGTGEFEHGVFIDDAGSTGTLRVTGQYRASETRDHAVTIEDADGRIAQYMFEYDPDNHHNTFKPFLHLINPATDEYLTADPSQGAQFDHHRGIFAGWNQAMVGLDMWDFWHSGGGERIVHQGFAEDLDEFALHQTLTSETEWVTGADEVGIEETREMRFRDPTIDSGISEVEVTLELAATDQPVSLWGDAEHAGVHIRAHGDVADNQSATYTFPEDAFTTDDPNDFDVRTTEGIPWVVMTCEMHGESYYFLQMRHEENPANEVWSAYRPYGRMGAFFEYELEEAESISVDYAFIVGRGDAPEPAEIEDAYTAFINRT